MQTSLLSNVTATGDDRQTNRNEVKQTAEQGSKQADCIEADVQTAEKQTTVPGGDSCIKVIGMLVVSLRGVTFRIWSYLEYLGWKGIILAHSCQLSLRAVHKEIYKEMP